jgi:hypothetical protein
VLVRKNNGLSDTEGVSDSRAAVSGPLSAAVVDPGGPACPGTAEVMIALRSDSRRRHGRNRKDRYAQRRFNP